MPDPTPDAMPGRPPVPMSDCLAVGNAVRTFGPEAGLFGVDLTVRRGEVHALVGLNGAGKTTLMRAILGMLRLTEGGIRLYDVPVDRLPAATRGRVGHLVEQPFAYPELSTRGNLTLAARLRGVRPERVTAVVEAAIDELDLRSYERVSVRRLSRGNRQRVGLAAALQHHPSLIVLDEPTESLDPAGVILLREALLRRARDGAAVLVSSHHLDEVARIADRISVLNRGRIIGQLDPGAPELERVFFERVRADDERRRG